MYRYIIKVNYGCIDVIYCSCKNLFYAFQILKLIVEDNKIYNYDSDNIFIYDNKLKRKINFNIKGIKNNEQKI